MTKTQTHHVTSVHDDHASALAAAHALIPALRERATETESQRTISVRTIEDLRAAGLFHLFTPRSFGGSQLGITTFIETVAALSSGCGSSGWVYAVLAGHNWTVSLLPEPAQQEVFGDADALVASVIHLDSAPVARVAGGYVIERARGRFCSGVDHASWILAGAQTTVAPNLTQPYYFLIPRSDFVVTDDWYAAGLRGTGSKSVSAERVFVPEHRVCALADALDGIAPGLAHNSAALYRAPFRQMQRLQLLGVPIGIATGAVELCRDAYARHHGTSGRDRHDDSRAAFQRLAHASVRLEAAVNLVRADAVACDAPADTGLSPAHERARCLSHIAHVAQECRGIVNMLFEASGARGLLDDNALQRSWRDANAAAAHVAFARDKAELPYGRLLCGLEE